MAYCLLARLVFLLTCSFSGADCFLSVWPDGPTLVTAFVGTNSTLRVLYSGATDPLVTWLNGTLSLATWTVGHSTPPDVAPAHRKVLSIDQTGSLFFQNVSVSYNGTYTVQISKPGTHEASVNFTLLVYNGITDASVVTASQDVVEGGSPFALSYSSTQGPVTTSTWYFKGSEVVNSSRYLITQKSLIVHQPNRNDTGLYSVVLTNPFSKVTQSKNVTVLYGPDQPVLEVSPTKATFVSGETVSLSCRAGGEPTPAASWGFNGQELPGSSGTLQLTRIQTSQSGVYTCVLINGRTNARVTRSVTINIQGADCFLSVWPDGPTLVTAFVGTNSTLRVLYSGATDPLVTWLNGTLSLATWTVGHSTPPDVAPAHRKVLSIDQTGSLFFQNVSVSYNGTYTVQISKPGTHEASVNFTLLVYNGITDASVVTASQDVVEGGSPFALSYSSTQGPVTTSTWYFKGSEVVNSSRYLITQKSLIVHQPNRNDTGLYSVVLTNPFSKVTQSKNVTVLYGPDQPVLEVSPTKATFVSGETVSLSCRAGGEPTPAASWGFNGQELPGSSGTLQLTRIQTSQSGVYTCVLINGRTNARVTRSVTINIQGLSVSAIAGVAAGVPCAILLLLLLAVLIFLCYRCCRKKAANQNPRYPVARAVKKVAISQPDLSKPRHLLINGLKQPPAYNHHRHQAPGERSGRLPIGILPVRMATTV